MRLVQKMRQEKCWLGLGLVWMWRKVNEFKISFGDRNGGTW